MPDDIGMYIAQALTGGVQGYQAKQEANRKAALEQSKIDSENMDRLAKQFTTGVAVDPATKKAGWAPGYLDPESDVYKGFSRESELKRLQHPDAAKNANPLTFGEVFATRGTPLPPELESSRDKPFASGYVNVLPQQAKPEPTMNYGDLNALVNHTAAPDAKIPLKVAGLVRPPAGAARAVPMTPAQKAAWSQMTGQPVEAAEGLTAGQFGSTVSNVTGQRAAGERQANQIGAQDKRMSNQINAQDARQANALDQGERHFKGQLDFEKNKTIESQLEKFRDDYGKAGIPAGHAAFKRLDELTGVLSSDKPNLKKMPGYGTNALRSVPLIGDALATTAAKTYGGQEESQLIQQLFNIDTHNLSGANVTKYEMGRNLAAHGMGAGGNEQDAARGIRMMYQAFQGMDQDIRAAYPPEVTELYQARGGMNKLNPVSAPQNPSDARARAASAKKFGLKAPVLDMIDDPANPEKNAAAQKLLARKKPAAPAASGGKMSFADWVKAGRPKAGP